MCVCVFIASIAGPVAICFSAALFLMREINMYIKTCDIHCTVKIL